ncbi:MAG TPA: hypothetical protein VFB82_08235 [Blastocatellia bacterium]|nr:hypothetical protein [Blastocatellia bacterium]
MSKQLIVSKLMILTMALMSLPVTQTQTSAAEGSNIKISSYTDDPFVVESNIGRLEGSKFGQDTDGHPSLSGDRVSMIEEDVIYREQRPNDSNPGTFTKFAWNPWPIDSRSNAKGNFNFTAETRFPIHEVERGADGKPLLKDGLQLWTPRDLHLGTTTAFAASNAARDAAEAWAGRDIAWGNDNVLEVESHIIIDFNAFYSPSARMVFFGIVPYRLPGETQVKMFETATSSELVGHECGHALLDRLKPNANEVDLGYNTLGESFGDQTEMWASLRDPRRVRAVLAETSGTLYTSNSLTRLCEAFAALVGKGTGIRDAFHNKKISNTTDEVHDRSEVLTGAAYKVFTLIYDDLKNGRGNEQPALTEAGDVMGVFLVHLTDYTPENRMTLEDVGKAYLKVDKELYGGRYRNMFVNEFINREIFNSGSVGEWLAHEAAVPGLPLPQRATVQKIDRLVQANLDKLGIGPDFGLKLQSVTRDQRFGQTIVRVQLTDGRGSDAPLLENHGILTFRADGTLADYHSPLPSDDGSLATMQTQARGQALMSAARGLRIDQHGAPLSIVRRPNGQLSIEARVMRTSGIYCWIEAFTLEHPEGERREVIIPTIPGKINGVQPSGVQILTADDLKQ